MLVSYLVVLVFRFMVHATTDVNGNDDLVDVSMAALSAEGSGAVGSTVSIFRFSSSVTSTFVFTWSQNSLQC